MQAQVALRYVCTCLNAKRLRMTTLNTNLLFSLAFGLLYKHTTSFVGFLLLLLLQFHIPIQLEMMNAKSIQ